MSVKDICASFSSLKQALADFSAEFQGNYLLDYLGMPDGRGGITTVNTHCFFAGDFFGIRVPVGYHKSVFA
jgi:hypothetical protein